MNEAALFFFGTKAGFPNNPNKNADSILMLILTQVKSVKLKPGANTHNGCGIDGELCRVKGQVLCSLVPEQCRLIGRQCRQSI